jgi:SAM-dependent methyltransferase
MLRELRDRWRSDPAAPAVPDLVVGDAACLPFGDVAFGLVAGLGNLVGFAEDAGGRVLAQLERRVGPGGALLLEVAPGPGERSRYLRRLPPSSVARLFRSAPKLVAARVEREGYAPERPRKPQPGAFTRLAAEELRRRLEANGFRVDEIEAVAPALGPDPARIAAVADDAKAWDHLLEVEEVLGRNPERWPSAAAVLVAATHRPPGATGGESEG